MNFTPEELSTIAIALKRYSEYLLDIRDLQADEERRRVWNLRDRIESWWKSQPSSATY